jgi:addiction module HigA family antidote
VTDKIHDPITPGEILLEEFLIPLGISQYRLAETIGVPPRRINEIVHGRRRITPETGLRMSRALGLSDRYWLNIQLDYDVEVERDRHTAELDAITSLTA